MLGLSRFIVPLSLHCFVFPYTGFCSRYPHIILDINIVSVSLSYHTYIGRVVVRYHLDFLIAFTGDVKNNAIQRRKNKVFSIILLVLGIKSFRTFYPQWTLNTGQRRYTKHEHRDNDEEANQKRRDERWRKKLVSLQDAPFYECRVARADDLPFGNGGRWLRGSIDN